VHPIKTQTIAVAAAAVAMLVAPAIAQEWPKARPIKWMIGLPPGGGVDPITRAVADKLAPRLGATIVIENKPGANQALAAQDVARSDADGYMLLSFGGPTLYSRPVPEIGTGTGLDPLAHLSSGPMILAGTSKNEQVDLKALITAIKAAPEKWSYATAGQASIHHIGGELINGAAGTAMKMVPYRGGGQSINDAVGGHVPLIVIGIGPVIPHVQSGTLRGYAVTSAARFPLLPNVPTMAEAGLPEVEMTQDFGVAIRTGTPRAIVERLNREINVVLALDEMKALILKNGAIAQQCTPEEWGAYFLKKRALATSIAKRHGIVVQE
jgi:tripartite-type tricarboxylate transporter receptor subunit TctC